MSEADVAGVAVDTRHWIGGRRVASPGTFTDLSPIDGQRLAEVARGGEAEVAAAVRAAREAFGGWSQTPPPDRATSASRWPSMGERSVNVPGDATRRPPIQCRVSTATPATLAPPIAIRARTRPVLSAAARRAVLAPPRGRPPPAGRLAPNFMN